ncbi:MAG: transcriptional repressor [Candidatus Aminicenantes bacterium]|nr:transcriptional repressor [Candidatus Aminicenantes bacterium]
MITNPEGAREILLTRGIKPTYQRQTILRAVLEKRTHPTIKALYDHLLPAIPTLSKTTLYSTLELFASRGLVSRLSIDSGEARYDGFAAPHHHFLCEACGAIIDLDIACPAARRGQVDGHKIKEIHGYFKGVCKDCQSHVQYKIPRRLSHA